MRVGCLRKLDKPGKKYSRRLQSKLQSLYGIPDLFIHRDSEPLVLLSGCQGALSGVSGSVVSRGYGGILYVFHYGVGHAFPARVAKRARGIYSHEYLR